MRRLAHPLVRFAGALLLLLWPWSIVGRAYGHLVVAVARLFLATGPASELRFPRGDDPWRLRVVAETLTTGRFVETALDLRRAGFIAAAVFIALVLATPVRWRRRAQLLALGLVPLSLLPLLPLAALFSGALPIQVFHPGTLTRAVLGIAYHVLVAAPGMAFAFPGLLWLLLLWLVEPAWVRARLRRVTHDQRADGVGDVRPPVAQHRGHRALAGRPR